MFHVVVIVISVAIRSNRGKADEFGLQVRRNEAGVPIVAVDHVGGKSSRRIASSTARLKKYEPLAVSW